MSDGRRHFHEELALLQERLVEMAGKVEALVADAVEALRARDPERALDIKARDDEVDAIELEIDDRVIELLALQQPMAVDLRQIVTTQKVSNDLERVGDHAVSIAKSAYRLSDMLPFPEPRELHEMATIARGMLADALAAYVSRDAASARAVCTRDDLVDDLQASMFRVLLTHMAEDPKLISPALEFLRAGQNLERIADLSTNISEDVVFLVEGHSIKHHAEERRERRAQTGA
ncbi:MAG: phosphate transport system regulatory protein PhoU [Gemmatimonadetes bacterium]|nr:MAG: phosphate transport system regulatory protein PhoU [Gemmatimonadota bacterium]